VRTLVDRVVDAGVPRHVALIMDGNGRWAAERGLPRSAGHQAGAEAAERLIRFVGRRLGIEYLTLYAFSTENWARPPGEVDDLMGLLKRFIEEKIGEFIDAGIRLRMIGEVGGLPRELADIVRDAVRRTERGRTLNLTIALNYGSRQEIVRACRRIGVDLAAGRLTSADLVEEAVSSRLDTAGIPDPDLLIRTSGEARLSNFLLWQAAYAELFFTDTYWPGFTPAELIRILATFRSRDRRFGGLGEESAR